MGSAQSISAAPPAYSEKSQHASANSRDRSSPSAADLLAQLSLRGSSSSPADATVTGENLDAWDDAFASNPKHRLASTVLSKSNFTEALVSRAAQRKDQQVFNVKLSTEGNPVTNQKSSGRCWLFASTNYLRILMARKYDLEDFQLSQSYLFFYDSLSKANWFLEQMLQLADEPLDDRTVHHFMQEPRSDGGQYRTDLCSHVLSAFARDMIVNLFSTFGLVPQSVFPESANSSATSKVDTLVTAKLREYALELRALHDAALSSLSSLDKSYAEKKALAIASARKRKEEQMSEVYRILCIALGQPPKPTETFTWEYYSKKDKAYHRVDTTPLEFYKKYCLVDVSTHLSLVNDPRHDYSTLLQVDRLGNVVGGQPVKYINTHIEQLKSTAIKLLKADIPVWCVPGYAACSFGCDVGKFSSSSIGIMDTEIYDLDEGFGITLGMDKAQRLRTGESCMTHAMLLTAVHVDEKTGKPVRWRVENSWGAEACDKGYMLMSDAWFSEFVYQIVADRKYIPKDLVDVFDKGKATVLPPWDPMGTLA
ncbi:bleomycin hydrolase [Rhodosporidiobolus nylandii]